LVHFFFPIWEKAETGRKQIKRKYVRMSYSSSFSSSSNNIQDQCLIITDICGVREKGGCGWEKQQHIRH